MIEFVQKWVILRRGIEISREWQLVELGGSDHEIQIDGRDRNCSAQLGVVLPCRLGGDARRRHAAARQAREGKLAAEAGSQSAAYQEIVGARAGSGRAGTGA